MTTRVIDWNNPNASISQYFTVSEVTLGDPRRNPANASESVRKNILRMAAELDEIREKWGSGIGTTSWYRPEDVNREVGGVDDSTHIEGHAVDVYPVNGDIWGFQNWLDTEWGNKALGYGAVKGFVHLDLRDDGRRWDY